MSTAKPYDRHQVCRIFIARGSSRHVEAVLVPWSLKDEVTHNSGSAPPRRRAGGRFRENISSWSRLRRRRRDDSETETRGKQGKQACRILILFVMDSFLLPSCRVSSLWLTVSDSRGSLLL